MDWLAFSAILLLVCLAIAGVLVWALMFRQKGKKQKRRKRRHRHMNPTLAQTGGLPPKRDPNQPPPGL